MLGRLGHIYGGDIASPHHWMYGFLMAIPCWFYPNIWLVLLAYLGVGVFISDLIDFLHFRIWGADEPGVKRFWGID